MELRFQPGGENWFRSAGFLVIRLFPSGPIKPFLQVFVVMALLGLAARR